MTSQAQKLLDAALHLSEPERAELAYALLDTVHKVDPDLESAWAEELARRVERTEAGSRDVEDWSTVRDRLLTPR